MDTPPSLSRFTRREFLETVSLAGVVAACARTPYQPADFALPAESSVALLPASDYGADLAGTISRGLDLLRPAVRGRRVLLKPNLIEYEPGAVINTDPAVIGGAIEAFRRAGASEVVVAEGPGHHRDTEYLISASGLSDHLRDLRARFVDLNLDDVRKIALRSHFTDLAELWLPAEVLRSDFVVSMPKLKTHHWAGMTAAMKNLFGVVPGAVYGWPKNLLHYRGIDAAILDLNATVRPAFTIVDAVVAMEGDGPIMGNPRRAGFLAMGADVVAVDATCARIMGLDPAKIRYLREASRFLGLVEPGKIRQRAESPARFARVFDIPAHLVKLRL